MALLSLLGLSGCSAPYQGSSFTLVVSPSTVSLVDYGTAVPVSVLAEPVNGFAAPVTVTLTGLPAGVFASPSTLTLVPGVLQQFSLVAAGATAPSSVNLTLQASGGSASTTATASLSIVPSTSAAGSTVSISTTTFNFGNDLVGTTLTQPVVTVTNTGTTALSLQPSLTGDTAFALSASQPCSGLLSGGTSCAIYVDYKPLTASSPQSQNSLLDLGLGGVASGTQQTVTLTGISGILAPGTVTTTINPQVAQYSMTLPFPGSMTVDFGTTTAYGHQTFTQSTTAPGQTINMLVAGMLGKTAYHMQATIAFTGGLTITDSDHIFTTKAAPAIPVLTATTTTGLTPQPGLQQLNLINGIFLGLAVTDLQGNLLWTYQVPDDNGGYTVEAGSQLPNGDFLLQIGQGSTFPLDNTASVPNAVVAIREIDLAGNIIREISIADLNNELAASGYTINNLLEFHHEVIPLPNGHWLVLANHFKSFTGLTGYTSAVNVLGDVIIDLDTNLHPVWVWDEFNHLDINRHPYLFPDWTHTNALVYTPDDGNLLVSIRNQNWIVKVDYNNGAGAGNILWHLGEGGDFKLVGGTDPTDWFYAQHYPSLFSPNSSGIFSIGIMDNGDDRILPAGVPCGATGEPPCLYTTIPILQLNETAKTATLTSNQALPASLYSYFGGNTNLLANGNTLFDLAGTVNPIQGSDIFEVTPTSTPQTVWQMHVQNANAYRSTRIPSLYPGVQW